MAARNRVYAAGAGVCLVTVALLGSTAAPVNADSDADWALNSSQVAQARQALQFMATRSLPSGTSPAVGAWPSNVVSGRTFGTDRAAANTAMGEPQAAPGDGSRRVICVEGHGRFSTAGIPRPQGAPAQVYAYVVACFDPATGDVLDSGYDDKPVTGTFSNSQPLDVRTPLVAPTDARLHAWGWFSP